jgi:hypothetical protein
MLKNLAKSLYVINDCFTIKKSKKWGFPLEKKIKRDLLYRLFLKLFLLIPFFIVVNSFSL